MSALVRRVHRWTMRVTAKVDATVQGDVTFTDADVREHFKLDDDAAIDPEMLDEYAKEQIGETDVELKDITFWNSSEAEMVNVEQTMSVPPEFVPLPGMEEL